ncbi:hypothetical protein [Promicromonospora sp. NPDC023805]|uniref:hypothetical protein n=1 Tax=Promicromonospora sp. NPDC023805 TaxID=3154696 RepID=UPI0033C93180
MTTIDPAGAVQVGLRDLFQSDPEIQQYISGVLDEVPDVAARQYPFIVIPDLTSVPDGTHDDPGRKVTARIQTLARGDVDVQEARLDNLIGARIVALLDHGHKTLDPFVKGATIWMVRHVESRKMPDADRTVRRRLDRVDIFTSQI